MPITEDPFIKKCGITRDLIYDLRSTSRELLEEQLDSLGCDGSFWKLFVTTKPGYDILRTAVIIAKTPDMLEFMSMKVAFVNLREALTVLQFPHNPPILQFFLMIAKEIHELGFYNEKLKEHRINILMLLLKIDAGTGEIKDRIVDFISKSENSQLLQNELDTALLRISVYCTPLSRPIFSKR